jgi:hypothetical protein
MCLKTLIINMDCNFMDKMEKNLFFAMGEKMLEMYENFPQGGSKRKIFAGTEEDPEKRKNIILFFQGNYADALAVYEFLNNRTKEVK